jgi:hypothetical protein
MNTALTCFDGVIWVGIAGEDDAMDDNRKEIERDDRMRTRKASCIYGVDCCCCCCCWGGGKSSKRQAKAGF